MSALQRGTNFALAPRKIPTAEIVAGVEDGIHALPEEDKLVLRSQISQVLQRATVAPSNLPRSTQRRGQSFTRSAQR